MIQQRLCKITTSVVVATPGGALSTSAMNAARDKAKQAVVEALEAAGMTPLQRHATWSDVVT